MQCVNPGHHWVVNRLTGGRSWMPYPCGKCIACLHNEQDSWAIRINETAKHTPRREFIYDTLTFSPQGLPYLVLSDIPRCVSQASLDLLSRYSKEYARVVGEEAQFVVPYVTRDIIRDWVRRGRELFVYHHGYRPNWKYIVFMEYGPKTSRPHFHLLFFNITLDEYVKFLAKPWRQKYGFTKTILVSNQSKKDRQCVSRYISKYCSKGVFESPLVQDRLSPKCFRCISRGIGEEYLSGDLFYSFRTEASNFLKGITAKPLYCGDGDIRAGYEYSRIRTFYELFGDSGWGLPSQSEVDKLTTYVDESSFKHSLPRYYKRKLLNSDNPNYYECAVQNLLLARTEQYYQSCLLKFALQLGYGNRIQVEAPLLGFSPVQYDSLSRQFVLTQRTQATAQAKGRFIKLKNHYFRPMRDKRYAFVS